MAVSSLSPSSSAVLPTTFAGGRYQLLRLLGEGSKKRVYLARDTQLDREVALALFKPDGFARDRLARIQREARALALLGHHPHIVTLYDMGEEQGQPYFVSQYMTGGTLQERLRNSEQRRLLLDEVLRLADQLCQALAYTHTHEIIHRDLKPSNVWLTQEGSIKLGDFGLAASLDHSRLSVEGVLVGTAAYLPPEQLQGRPIDARSDLYSLGAMLYEMVTGRPPFVGDGLVSLIAQHLNAQPVAPSVHNQAIPPALDALILRLLAKSPEERPENVAVVREELQVMGAVPVLLGKADAPHAGHLLDRLAGNIFVGREREMDFLREHLEEALAGRGRSVVLLGEPGIGKTRLATEVVTYARLRGAQVLIGRCHEGEGAPPYWLWVQIIRSYLAERDPATLRTEMGSSLAGIAEVAPEVRALSPDLPIPPLLEPEQARFRFFDSYTRFLKNAAKSRPLMVIVDDLQWADTPSLLLLQFVARELGDARLLLIVTCRENEVEQRAPLSHSLATLARTAGSQTLTLQGLRDREVFRFIELTTGQAPTTEIATVVYRETEGHPFFMTETVRLLATETRSATRRTSHASLPRLPQSVRSVIERRLEHISEDCRRLLTVASVIGREFSLTVLEGVWGVSPLPLLDEAVAARLITHAPRGVGLYSCSHALIREALYESLPVIKRAQLHQRIGEELEELYRAYPEPYLAELAHHFHIAAQYGGDMNKALSYSWQAGDRALAALAYEEAVDHYQRALLTLELTAIDSLQQCELLLALGEAQRRSGLTPQARATFLQVASLAKALKARLGESPIAPLLARAALGVSPGFAGTSVKAGIVDSVVVALLEDALLAFGEENTVLKVKVLGRLTLELYWSDAAEKRFRLGQCAVEIARRLADPAALAYALHARRTALWGPEDIEHRLHDAAEIVHLAEQINDQELLLQGYAGQIADLLERGDVQTVAQVIAAYVQRAEELRQPYYLWLSLTWKAMLSGMEGRFGPVHR